VLVRTTLEMAEMVGVTKHEMFIHRDTTYGKEPNTIHLPQYCL